MSMRVKNLFVVAAAVVAVAAATAAGQAPKSYAAPAPGGSRISLRLLKKAVAGQPIPIQVSESQNGQPLKNIRVQLSASAGHLAPATVITNARGQAVDTLTAAPVGAVTVRAASRQLHQESPGLSLSVRVVAPPAHGATTGNSSHATKAGVTNAAHRANHRAQAATTHGIYWLFLLLLILLLLFFLIWWYWRKRKQEEADADGRP